MALKQYNPTSPGRRQLVLVDKSELHKGRPEKSLVEGLTKSGGRGGGGRIAVRFRGGGAKRLYRKIDFKRRKWDMPATVERLEYDPNRSAFIALISYADGEQAYILAPQRLAVGDKVIASASADVKPGNAMPMSAMPVGTIVHNVELKLGRGGAIAAELLLSQANHHHLGDVASVLEEGAGATWFRRAQWLARGGLAARVLRRHAPGPLEGAASVAFLVL